MLINLVALPLHAYYLYIVYDITLYVYENEYYVQSNYIIMYMQKRPVPYSIF